MKENVCLFPLTPPSFGTENEVHIIYHTCLRIKSRTGITIESYSARNLIRNSTAIGKVRLGGEGGWGTNIRYFIQRFSK